MGLLIVKPFINVTEDDLKDVTPSDISFEEKLKNVRRSLDGNLAVIEVNIRDIGSTKLLDGIFYVYGNDGKEIGRLIDPDIELVKPEWNPLESDINGDGIVTEEELSIWQKIVNWFK